MTMVRAIWIVGAVFLFGVNFFGAEPALTIYNQNFAVVREIIPLDLKAGVNQIRFTDTTAYLEPGSVILRDPAGKQAMVIVEQNYRADPMSQELLLSLNEGQTIQFLVQRGDQTEIVQGKVVRSGFVSRAATIWVSGPYPYYTQPQPLQPPTQQPIIEVDGKLRFGLPGTPLFPPLPSDTVLKPTLNWVIEAEKPGKTQAEFSYVTGGLTWEADYNVVSPENSDVLNLVGWVTMTNQSGKTFENAKIKLMAGDVSKIQPSYARQYGYGAGAAGGTIGGIPGGPPVTEKPFEEYHLYELHRPSTLHDQETKQVEFVRAEGIQSKRIYVYNGLKVDQSRYQGWNLMMIRQDRDYGTESNPKVWVMREFVNSQANHLGMPLPGGRLRFYMQDKDTNLEFTGENVIQHTPRDETIRVYTGAAFDLVGERRRTNYRIDTNNNWMYETFEIKLRNHKKEAVEVRVVEHLYRGTSWEITEKSDTFLKTDSQTMEFRVQVEPEAEKVVRYSVDYRW